MVENIDADFDSDHNGTITSLAQEIKTLRNKVAFLEGQLAISEKRYMQLLTKLDSPAGPDSTKLLYQPTTTADPFMLLLKDAREHATSMATREHFPKVVYWTKNEYLKDYKGGKGYLRTINQDNSGAVGFLEDENGTVVSKEEQARMREFQRSLAYTLLQHKLAPTSWSRCTQAAREYFVLSMRTKFPILRFCADDWKADTFMGLYYSQWTDRPHAAANGDAIKQELIENTTNSFASKAREPSKRPSSITATTTMSNLKRSKTEPTVISVTSITRAPHLQAAPSCLPTLPSNTGMDIDLGPNIPAVMHHSTTRSHNTTVEDQDTGILAIAESDSHMAGPDRTGTDRGLDTVLDVNFEIRRTLTTPDVVPNTMTTSFGAFPQSSPGMTASSTTAVSSNSLEPLRQLASIFLAHESTPAKSPAATAEANPSTEQQPKKKRREPDPNSIMRPSANSMSARNLYSFVWCKENKGGTRGQYNAAWEALKASNDPRVAEYGQRAAEMKLAKKNVGFASTSKTSDPDGNPVDEE